MSAGMVEARRNEERQGVNPAPVDPQLLARLRLDACDSTSLMVEQYKVPFSRAIPPCSLARDFRHVCASCGSSPFRDCTATVCGA